jgi:hypothetical protein
MSPSCKRLATCAIRLMLPESFFPVPVPMLIRFVFPISSPGLLDASPVPAPHRQHLTLAVGGLDA